MTCEYKNQGNSEESFAKENFRKLENKSDDEYANIDSSNKIKCKNLRGRN